MPGMMRIPGVAKKIAYKILGVPANIAFKPTPKQVEIDRKLMYQEKARVK